MIQTEISTSESAAEGSTEGCVTIRIRDGEKRYEYHHAADTTDPQLGSIADAVSEVLDDLIYHDGKKGRVR